MPSPAKTRQQSKTANQAKTQQQKTSKHAVPKRTRGRPTLQDAAAIDDALLSVALSEFMEHGYGGASMSRIAKLAKMSKATLYLRFSSKEDLFRAIMHKQIDRNEPATLLSTQSGPLSLEEGLRTYANRMLQLSFEGDMLAINRLIYSESHRFPEVGAAAAERTNQGIQRIAEFIRERAKLDGIPCKDPEIIAGVFIYAIRGWYVSHMLSNRTVSASLRGKWVKRAIRSLLASRHDW